MVSSPHTPPAEAYQERLLAHEREHQRLGARHIQLGYVRLFLFGTILALAWTSLFRHHGSPWLLTLPAVLFLVAMVSHNRVRHQQSVAVRAADVYRKGLARMEDR